MFKYQNPKGHIYKRFLNGLETWNLHVKYTRIQENLKTFGAHLIRKKNF
jgi:hypothetical protein